MGRSDEVDFFRLLESHRSRLFLQLMRRLPRDPRCAICRAPYEGIGGRVMGTMGFAPSRKNPRLCSRCFELAPMGGTALAAGEAPDRVADLLNRFYAGAVTVLCEHAIVDKLVGDQVMALYLPGVFEGDPVGHMLADAAAVLAEAGYREDAPWVEVGVGVDFGTAFVGNVGAGEVKDFTAVGDVVNTAARLQSAAAGGEVVMSAAVGRRAGAAAADAEARELSLKGKSEPERALVLTIS